MQHRSVTTAFALAACLALGFTTAANAAEKKIERSALPPAVEKTLAANLEGATIKGFSTEREHGVQLYEAETILNGHTRDMEIQADGTLNEIEEEVGFDTLPAGVQTALTARARGSKITKVESLTKQGKLVAYEAATFDGSNRGEIQVGPNGQRLTHEE